MSPEMQPNEELTGGETIDRSPSDTYLQVLWTKRDILLAIVLGIVVLLGLLIIMLLAPRLYQQATGAPQSPRQLGVTTLLAELGLLVPVWLLGVRKYRLPWSSVGFRRFDVSRGLGLGCLFLVVSFAFNFVWSTVLLILAGVRAQPDVLPQFGGGTGGLLLALLVGALVAPIAEEAFFRGYLFAGLRRHVGFRQAVLVSAGLFALVHMLPTSWPPIFMLGVLFALLYEQTGSIWPAVIVHALMNTLALLASYLLQLLIA